jgi:glycosyltransferase involved in cell wall biosynthesis
VKLLFIAPLPPPITGHSLAAEVLRDDLAPLHEMRVVDLSVGSTNDGSLSRRRILEVGKVLMAVWRQKRGVDAIYLTISESVAGNIKDLLIYLLCAPQLSHLYIHLHGGSIRKLLFDRHPVLRRLNVLAVRRMGGVIVSGRSHEHIFAPMIERRRIHTVPNFARDDLFVDATRVQEKFAAVRPLRVLYLSGMTAGKGYQDLAEAYLLLGAEARERLRIDFAGKFDSPAERAAFEERIAGVPGIEYHGLVDDAQKRALFAGAHVFCLPTTMFEGQPISILEAYAAGCVVVTTGQDGIRDVFTDGTNGFEIDERSPRSIADRLDRLTGLGSSLASMAEQNRRLAEERYRTRQFTATITRILER